MSDHTVPQWKQRLKQAAVVAGIALAGYNTVLLSTPTDVMHSHNGARSEAATLESALDRFNVASHFNNVKDFDIASLRAGSYDKFFDVREPTEAGRLAALNTYNNTYVQRVDEATRNDMARMIEMTGFSTIEKDNPAVGVAKFAAASVLGAATILTYPRNFVSVKIDDAFQMIKGTDAESKATDKFIREEQSQVAARENVERIQDELKGHMSPNMASLMKQFDLESARGIYDQNARRVTLDLTGDNLTDNGRKIVQQILATDEGKQALARAEKKETREQFLARRDKETDSEIARLASAAPQKLASGMHRMLGIDKADDGAQKKKKRPGLG